MTPVTFAEAVMAGVFEDVYVRVSYSGDIVYACPGVGLNLLPGDELHLVYPNGREEVIVNSTNTNMAPLYCGEVGFFRG